MDGARVHDHWCVGLVGVRKSASLRPALGGRAPSTDVGASNDHGTREAKSSLESDTARTTCEHLAASPAPGDSVLAQLTVSGTPIPDLAGGLRRRERWTSHAIISSACA